ncbi:MAG: hypothetical protein P8Z35_02380 [Ignavibacteriaceae bacterium]
MRSQTGFTDKRNTKVYKIDKMPAVFHKPIKLKIKYNKDPGGSTFVAIGSEEFIPESEETIMMYNPVPAADSSGFLCIDILPAQFSRDSISYLNKSNVVEEFSHPAIWIFMGLSKREIHITRTSEINHDAGLDNSNAILLGQLIDGAVDYFSEKMLISESLFSSGDKIKVFIYDDYKTEPAIEYNMPEIDSWNYVGQSGFLTRFDYLISKYKINLNETYYKSATEDDLRMIAAEAAYYFIMTLWLGNETNWFHWASLYWLKHQFSNEPQKWEGVFANNRVMMQPFKGIEKGQETIDVSGLERYCGKKYSIKVAGHGVGMSPFIKFIMDNYDNDGKLLNNIFVQMLNSKCIGAEALINSISVPEYTWWPEFFKEYLTGNIFNISSDVFLSKIASLDELHFNDETDTLKTFDRTYPDLSAKLCRINISQTFKEKGTLKFKIGPPSLNLDYVEVLVFGLVNDQLVFINRGTDIIVGQLGDYSSLVACVVNSGNEPPYTGNSNINLEVKSNLRDWNWPYVNILIWDIDVDIESYSPYYNRRDTFKTQRITLAHQPYELNKKGNVFTGKKDIIYDWETYTSHDIGEVKISIDESNYNVLSFALNDSSNYDLNINAWKFEGFNIPLVYQSETHLEQRLENNVQSHITKLEWFKVENAGLTSERQFRLLKIVDDSNAWIQISWNDKLP